MADAVAEVQAFNAYTDGCTDQDQDHGHQQEPLTACVASANAAVKNDVGNGHSPSAGVSSLASQTRSSPQRGL